MKEITIYTTNNCPFCNQAKTLLKQAGYGYKEVDLSSNQELRMKLSQENNGYRTVPMIFIGDEFVGGFSELAGLKKNNELAAKIES